MGRGIAMAAAVSGYRTILEDLLPNALRKAETHTRTNLDKAVELGKVNATDADAAFSRLEYAGSIDQAARDADLVIEAVPEEMESKIEIFHARQDLPSYHDSRFEHFLAQRHRDRQRYLSREEVRRHALFQSRAQDEAARNRARA